MTLEFFKVDQKFGRVSRAQSPMKIVHGPSPHIRTDALMMEHVKKVADQRVPSSTRGPMSYRPDASNPPHVNGDALMMQSAKHISRQVMMKYR